MTLKILESTSTSILYELPAGKPDRNKPRELVETREWDQPLSAQKGPTCFYYAGKRIGKQIGKKPCKELENDRIVQKTCSTRRKATTFFYEKITNNPEQLMFARYQTNKEFLSKFGYDVEKEIVKVYQDKKLSNPEKLVFSQGQVELIEAMAFGLSVTSWNPGDKIEGLIETLRNKKVILIRGAFGTEFYEKKPFKLSTQIGGRDIYGWESGAKRVTAQEFGVQKAHAVIVVGAIITEEQIDEKTGKKTERKEHVLFIDPNNPSTPKNPTAQKIYKITFKNLCENIRDLRGWSYPSPFNAGYGYHGVLEVEQKNKETEFSK